LKPRVLITGVGGFTGKYLKETLEKDGYTIFGCSLHANAKDAPAAVDLCDISTVRKFVEKVRPNLVFHLGGISNVAHDNVNDLYATNIVGSRNLLQALVETNAPVTSVMMVSSANVYGDSGGCALSENTQTCPANDYAISKLAMEQVCSLWSDKLPIFIVRPFNYTGVGQSPKFLVPKIIQHYAQKQDTIALGNLKIFREFNDVRQIVEIYHELAKVCPANQTINVCSGNVYSLEDIIDCMNTISGYTINVKVDSRFVREHEIELLKGSTYKLDTLIKPVNFFPIENTLKWMYDRAKLECVSA
jgi:nucleoside-diphosphate-sugar epimerase